MTGKKGTGKTLFVQLLSDKVMELGLPVLLVSEATPGLSDFLKTIKQEVMVVFDEFEKVFPKGSDANEDEDNNKPNQNALLWLLDGTSSQKMLFVFTANYEDKINRLLINRPGRIYYHFVFSNPEKDEVERYMNDKVPSEYHKEVKKLLSYTLLHSFTFDELRAIANELASGYSLKETLQDLNIYAPSLEDGIQLVATFTYANGEKIDSNFEKFLATLKEYMNGAKFPYNTISLEGYADYHLTEKCEVTCRVTDCIKVAQFKWLDMVHY